MTVFVLQVLIGDYEIRHGVQEVPVPAGFVRGNVQFRRQRTPIQRLQECKCFFVLTEKIRPPCVVAARGMLMVVTIK